MGGKAPPGGAAGWAVDAAAERAKVAPLWESLYSLVHKHDVSNAAVPATRNETHDFVREGKRIPPATVSFVRSRLNGFMAEMPPYPAAAFSGRGLVTVGGGMRYIIPAWIMVHQLRHKGCSLPVEMWYPISEYPPQAVVDAFEKLGVTSRKLDFRGLNITSFKDDPKSKSFDPTGMARFTIKVAALLLSRFQEVIYLDADNIPLRDPSFLLDSPEYNATGALLWQDFWDNTLAPEAEAMLGVPRGEWHPGSFESGQMVVDKKRHWRGLLAAAYFNSYAHFWYEVFTCFLGKGDKETFAYGMAAAREPSYVMPMGPGALGTTGTSMSCNHRTHLCRDEFTGNTMVQYDAAGAPLFLHSNLHKWDMRLPEKFSLHYQRRWQVLLPGPVSWEDWMRDHLGEDLEHKVYEWVRMLRCMPWWEPYYEARLALGDRKTPDLDGFHYLLRGIELPKLYRAGWTGVYEALLEGLSFGDWRAHKWNKGPRPRLAAWGLSRRWHPGWDSPA
ncbi:MAG: mannosyltransferase putative-domain-containing protein [Monoraphidium minutum]|nr:MAG: mannosyltransferase putative-domain-containing protein [Monoraphidium minutum]